MTKEGRDSIADDLLRRLPGSPDAYPQKIDLTSLTVLLIEFSASAYRAASFLDDRILGPTTRGGWVPIQPLAEASRRVTVARPLHFIFHTGHVGSTLVSRLLDETGSVLSLREPLPLRTLAEAQDVVEGRDSLLSGSQLDLLIETFLGLWARGYEATRVVAVKATSSAGRLSGRILAKADRARAIYMNLRPEPYLATLLAGPNSPLDLRGHGPERIRRLGALSRAPLAALHALSIGELAAMSWLVESWTQRQTVSRFNDRVLKVDFDDLLADVEAGAHRIFAHFELPENDGRLGELSRSSVLTRYAKAPEYAYSPEVRLQVLRDSRRRNGEEIRKGMDWLDRLSRADPAVTEVLEG